MAKFGIELKFSRFVFSLYKFRTIRPIKSSLTHQSHRWRYWRGVKIRKLLDYLLNISFDFLEISKLRIFLPSYNFMKKFLINELLIQSFTAVR